MTQPSGPTLNYRHIQLGREYLRWYLTGLWLQLWLQAGVKGTTRGRFDATALLYEAEKVERDLEKGISEGGKIFLEISDLTEIERRPGPDLTLQ